MKDWARDLKLLHEEDIIWYIYFFIVLFALIANSFEEKYIYHLFILCENCDGRCKYFEG